MPMTQVDDALAPGLARLHADCVDTLDALEAVLAAHFDGAHRSLAWSYVYVQAWPYPLASRRDWRSATTASLDLVAQWWAPLLSLERALLNLGCDQSAALVALASAGASGYPRQTAAISPRQRRRGPMSRPSVAAGITA